MPGPLLILRPARLPRRARVLGALAVAAGMFAAALVVADVQNGRSVWGSGIFLATVSSALAWALCDTPLRYQLGGGELHVVTRVRRVTMPACRVWRAPGVGKDRFAINGGFGWYGWFRFEGGRARAWVTDPAFVVAIDTGAGVVLVSPAEPERMIGGA